MAEQYRDKEGHLVAYRKTPGCSFGEVLAVRIEERMGRMESNMGDTRIEIRTLMTELDDNKKQISLVCAQLREAINEMRIYLKDVSAVIDKASELDGRMVKVERHVSTVTVVTRIGAWIVGVCLSIVGVLLGITKIKGGG